MSEQDILNMLIQGEQIILKTQQSRFLPGGSRFTPDTVYITNHRVIFRNPKLLGLKKEYIEVYHRDVNRIQLNAGVFSTEIYIFSRFQNEPIIIPAVDKGDAERIGGLIRQGMAGAFNDQEVARIIFSRGPNSLSGVTNSSSFSQSVSRPPPRLESVDSLIIKPVENDSISKTSDGGLDWDSKLFFNRGFKDATNDHLSSELKDIEKIFYIISSSDPEIINIFNEDHLIFKNQFYREGYVEKLNQMLKEKPEAEFKKGLQNTQDYISWEIKDLNDLIDKIEKSDSSIIDIFGVEHEVIVNDYYRRGFLEGLKKIIYDKKSDKDKLIMEYDYIKKTFFIDSNKIVLSYGDWEKELKNIDTIHKNFQHNVESSFVKKGGHLILDYEAILLDRVNFLNKIEEYKKDGRKIFVFYDSSKKIIWLKSYTDKIIHYHNLILFNFDV